MFDLNMIPTTLVEGEVNPQDSGTEKKLQIKANLATSPAPKKLASSSRNYTFDSSDLAPLLLMVQDLPNDHPTDPSTPSRLLNSNHARLPPDGPATAWRGSSSAVPKQLAMLTTAAGDGAPAVRDVNVSPLFRHGQMVELFSRNDAGGGLCVNQNQASPCQTTMDLDCDVLSDGESDSWKPKHSCDNSNPKTVLVDLDDLPHESPVELQFPWSPVHQAAVPLHTTLIRGSSETFHEAEVPPHPTLFPGSSKNLHQSEAPLPTAVYRESSENLQVSARNLTPKELEEDFRLREVAFNAAFKLETQRCIPRARCRSCLAFCQRRLSKKRKPSLQEGCGTGKALQVPAECPPVLRNVVDDEGRQMQKMARHGPKSKSSEYRGVTFYKRTGRWEAHIWYDSAQIYLGASETKEEAARAYDQAALVLYGYGTDVDINFEPESYQVEIAYLYKLTKEQLVIYLRRDSRGYGAQVSYPAVKHVKNLYQATYELTILGTFTNEEDAARAVFKEAVRNSDGFLASSILDTHHVRNMPSYAYQRYAALYPEAVEALEATQLRNQANANATTSKSPSLPQKPPNSLSAPQIKKRSTRQRRQATQPQPNQASTSPPASAITIAAPLRPGAAQKLPRHQFTNDTATLAHLQQLRNVLPKVIRASAAAATASSSSSGPSIPLATGEAPASSGVIRFKLFNVDISVAVEPH